MVPNEPQDPTSKLHDKKREEGVKRAAGCGQFDRDDVLGSGVRLRFTTRQRRKLHSTACGLAFARRDANAKPQAALNFE